jgi:membrane protease YdiL (CAAX protease family)
VRLVRRPWLTASLVVPIGFAYVAATTAAAIAAAAVLLAGRRETDISDLTAAGLDADFVSIAAWAGTAVAVPLIVLVARRQALTTAGELLGWNAPAARQALVWLGVLLLFLVGSDALTLLLGREIVPQVMLDMYASADVPIVFWATLILAAPLFEELLFRGLLFRALVETRLGFVGAALLSSLCWSTLHVQYDGYGIASIFAGGLLLAAARYFTGSVLLCIGMHATMNLLASLEVLWLSGT